MHQGTKKIEVFFGLLDNNIIKSPLRQVGNAFGFRALHCDQLDASQDGDGTEIAPNNY